MSLVVIKPDLGGKRVRLNLLDQPLKPVFLLFATTVGDDGLLGNEGRGEKAIKAKKRDSLGEKERGAHYVGCLRTEGEKE
jgi:hypothetical protein